MGPKPKGKGKDKGKGKKSSKNSELIKLYEDITHLKTKLNDTNTQIKEEKKINSRLLVESEATKEQIRKMEEQIITEREQHRWNKQKCFDGKKSMERKTEERIKELEDEEREIHLLTSDFDFLQTQNLTLHSWLKGIVKQYEVDRQRREEEKEVTMQRNFDMRMSMDQILRKTILNFDSDYNQKAVQKMNHEALLAKQDNDRLFSEFARREDTCETLIRKQQSSFEQLMKSRVELEVVEASNLLQEQLVYNLEDRAVLEDEQLQQTQQHNDSLVSQINTIREAVDTMSCKSLSLQQLVNDIDHYTDMVDKIRPKVIEYGKDVVKFAMVCSEMDRTTSILCQSNHQDPDHTVDDDGNSLALSASVVDPPMTNNIKGGTQYSDNVLGFGFDISECDHEDSIHTASGGGGNEYIIDPKRIWNYAIGGNDSHLSSIALRMFLKEKRELLLQQMQSMDDIIKEQPQQHRGTGKKHGPITIQPFPVNGTASSSSSIMTRQTLKELKKSTNTYQNICTLTGGSFSLAS